MHKNMPVYLPSTLAAVFDKIMFFFDSVIKCLKLRMFIITYSVWPSRWRFFNHPQYFQINTENTLLSWLACIGLFLNNIVPKFDVSQFWKQ